MSQLQAVTYHTVKAISSKQWTELECTSNVYFSNKFLKAFEVSNPNIDFKYIVVSENNNAIALAIIQTIELSVDVILKNIKLANWLKKLAHSLFCKKVIKIMTNGNIFLSGEYGTFLKEGEEKVETFECLAEGIRRLSKSLKRLHGLFVKDFKNESIYITKHLDKFGYTPMQVEPNMIITLKT